MDVRRGLKAAIHGWARYAQATGDQAVAETNIAMLESVVSWLETRYRIGAGENQPKV